MAQLARATSAPSPGVPWTVAHRVLLLSHLSWYVALPVGVEDAVLFEMLVIDMLLEVLLVVLVGPTLFEVLVGLELFEVLVVPLGGTTYQTGLNESISSTRTSHEALP